MAEKELLMEYPELKGFAQHGVLFTDKSGNQLGGTCPFCNKSRKFYVNVKTLLWDCKKCARSGNFTQFLKLVSRSHLGNMKGRYADELADDRGLMRKTLKKWRVGWSGMWYTIPVDATGRITDIRRYKIGGKCLSTTGGKVGLVGVTNKSDTVWLLEGEWDGMTMSEILDKTHRNDSVYAVCGAGSFPKDASGLFQGKTVNIIFDHDAAGIKGESRTGNLIEGYAKKVMYLHWTKTLPEGFDLRDMYQEVQNSGLKSMKFLNENLKDHPREEVEDGKGPETEVELPTGPGLAPDTVLKEFRKWLHIREPNILSVIFGAILANRLNGDPVWLFVVGPPGSMKTEVLMSTVKSPLIISTTSLTVPALISGANTLGGDPSLIPKLNGKVLIVKDFTAILSMQQPVRDEIFGILRDAYDGRVDKFFGNGVERKYESRFGIIAAVTNIIEAYSSVSSVLGERFLKYQIKEPGSIDKGKNMIKRALQNVAKEGQMREDLVETTCKALSKEVDPDKPPKVPDKFYDRFLGLAQWVAAMRGVVGRDKYTREIQYKPTSEIGTRLAKQLCKLAMGIAIYHRKDEIDEDVYQMIVKVAKDTGPDRVEEIVKQLYLKEDAGFLSTNDISELTKFPTGTLSSILDDLRMLNVVRKDPHKRGYWSLSKAMVRKMKPLKLYDKEENWTSRKKGRSK